VKPKKTLYIVRCMAKPSCGSGAVWLRHSIITADKAALDHAAKKRHKVGPEMYETTPEYVDKIGYTFVPTRTYDDADRYGI
jgi:hypothetical protein